MKKNLTHLIGLSTLALVSSALTSAALARPLISAQSIIVNPIETALKVQVYTDRDPNGNSTPGYNVGDRIRLFVKPNQNAYIYLFNVDPSGKVDLVLPNKYSGGSNYVKANQTKAFPDSRDPFTFDISNEGGYGVNKVLALASKKQLNINDIARFQSQSSSSAGGFAEVRVTGEANLARALSIVVTPIPQDSWVSDTAFYTVLGGTSSNTTPPPQPAPGQGTSYGSVNIVTNFNGAEIFINDRRYGRAPTTVADLAPGTYKVTVRARGFDDYTVTITVQSNQTASVTANFQ